MQSNDSLTILARKVPPLRFQNYLRNTGWTETFSDDLWCSFENNSEPQRNLSVPLRSMTKDYGEAAYQAIKTLSAFEERDPYPVMIEILNPPIDILKLRYISKDFDHGNIPFEDGLNYLKSVKTILLAVASKVERPSSYYPRLGFQKSVEFLQKCRLGQTEIGSFIFSIYCPVEESGSLLEVMDVDGDSFSRKTICNVIDRKSTRLNSSHTDISRMPSSA